ncbi:PhoH family protein [Roseibium alexandrii]|uniref:PhoH family protein n=1 Tax=Roseibium alexandrii TaxID=388408 RepID=UPI00058B990C|nr:PhoH family protein [Roseibium alexandrii]
MGPQVPPLLPKTSKQQMYLDALRSSPQVFAIGPAGTGKTFLPAAYAGDLLMNNQVSKVVLTRPNVPAGPSLGFFPGTLEEKMAPWVIPFLETMSVRMGGQGAIDTNIKRGNIEVVPFETMRGRSFDDAFIIVDEAQNLTPSEMYMILTRIGEESQIVITGDLRQKDIKSDSGLQKAIETVYKHAIPAAVINFDHTDIVRSGICAQWVKHWED